MQASVEVLTKVFEGIVPGIVDVGSMVRDGKSGQDRSKFDLHITRVLLGDGTVRQPTPSYISQPAGLEGFRAVFVPHCFLLLIVYRTGWSHAQTSDSSDRLKDCGKCIIASGLWAYFRCFSYFRGLALCIRLLLVTAPLLDQTVRPVGDFCIATV